MTSLARRGWASCNASEAQITDEAYEVALHKLAGRILLSKEAVDDASFEITPQFEQALKDKFSGQLDADLVNGEGPAPIPTGVLSTAPEVTAADWELAAIKAKAEIGTYGGSATNIAVSPAVLGDIESARETTGCALYPDAASEPIRGPRCRFCTGRQGPVCL